MKQRNQQTTLEKIVLGIFRGIWWLIKLPFGGWKRKPKLSVADRQYIIEKKEEIRKLGQSENQFELRHALMEADKLTDWILKKENYNGETFADRLRSAEKDLPKNVYNSIWEGHKIRNRIAHEDGKISANELRSAIIKLMNFGG